MLFEIGAILKLYVEDTTPPKVKLCLIVGSCSDKIAVVYINSEVNPNFLPADLQGLHCPITKKDCDKLSYESYADCSDIFEKDKSELNTLLQKEPGRKLCKLSNDRITMILGVLQRARTIWDYFNKCVNLKIGDQINN
ncbi:hypothetical protein [Chitinophaga polysaccharea]|uniref:hypothetical protein n=1 Tax=Chitinophaga polysaccharea TaxID=1293035 RepID=UPI001157BB33|nr:hypothetical protein [Chitinophaga polysaccharea]